MSDEGHFIPPESSLLNDVRQAQVIAPDNDSVTRFAPFVQISPEARDALVAVAEAALAVADEGWFGVRSEGSAAVLSGALERLRA